MRYAFLILNLFCLTLFSQVNPPDLRCLQVLPNGNVTLTWIPPTDPGGLFDSYDIYYSQTATGTFVVVGNINTINTTTFTHVGSNATVSSVYYYVRTKFNPGGTSAPSDTLRTVFLNLINTAGAPDVKLVYNNVHQPSLPSTPGAFSIAKEYPAATWSNLATTNALNYADTISVCSASLNYQVTLPDNSGCISSSNIQGGTFTDNKSPNQPYIDSISVLPNGNVVLAWHIPRDLDITKYIIVKNIPPNNTYTDIDSVMGRNNTVYTFTTTEANSNAVQIYSYAVDSCGNPGSYDVLPTTMFLEATYDKCAYKTNLTWNPYVNIPKGILEYRIYASVNNSPYLMIGSTTQTNFTVDNVPPNKNVCYFIRVINTPKTITASSNRTCIFSIQVPASNFVYIKKASVKDKYSAEVTIYLDTTASSQGIDIYRSTDGINFDAITFIPYSGAAHFYYLDEKLETNEKNYYYKAVVRDSCGNSRTYSNIAKTILLKVKGDEENIFTYHLDWNDYLGFAGGVSGYNIYRIINDVQSTAPVASTGPLVNNYTDNLENEASNGSKIEYLIEGIEGIGNPYGFMETSKSNTVAVYMEGKIFVPTAFAPRGKNKIWLPVTHFVDKSEYTVTVFNRWGNKVFETNDDTKGWDGSGYANDVYVYLITYKNARGEYKELKGTVMLFQ